MLALSLHAVALRLRTDQTFDNLPVADFGTGIEQTIRHDLSAEEQKLQNKTKTLWDAKTRKHQQTRGGVSQTSFKTIFKDVTDARLAAVHPLCLQYRYGESEDQDFEVYEDHDEKTKEEILSSIAGVKCKQTTLGSKNRIALRAATKNGKWKSSRMAAFVQTIRKHRNRHLNAKILVFSEFLSALDIAENALKETFGDVVRITRYDGTVDDKEREKMVENFQTSDNYNMMLMTGRCGGLGITLTEADGIVHLSESWNGVVTRQANARVIRIGSDKQVYVYYMYAHHSIERRIKKLQKLKIRKACKALDPDDDAQIVMDIASKMSIEEFRKSVSCLRLTDVCRRSLT